VQIQCIDIISIGIDIFISLRTVKRQSIALIKK